MPSLRIGGDEAADAAEDTARSAGPHEDGASFPHAASARIGRRGFVGQALVIRWDAARAAHRRGVHDRGRLAAQCRALERRARRWCAQSALWFALLIRTRGGPQAPRYIGISPR
jgi:hypothetical protein